MKNPFSTLLGLVGAMLCLGSCQQPSGPGTTGNTKPAAVHDAATVLTDADTGKEIKLRVGDTLTVRLTANATTGYGWRTKERKGESLTPVGKQPEYAPDPAAPGVVGSGGHNLFRYKVIKKGVETLGFVYVQPQKPDQVAKQVRFRVVVQ